MDRPRARRARVLCVDEDPLVLSIYARCLNDRYDTETVRTGADGLKALAGGSGPEVVLANLQMRGMDGATFLQMARQAAPDAVRILIAGQVDLSSAVASVNEAQVFRLLTKPCTRGALLVAVGAAVDHHRAVAAERVLLERTLQGTIRILADVLALADPESSGRATRIKQHVTRLADQLKVEERWQIEVAALVSQIGWISLPQEIAEKLRAGEPISEAERPLVARVPAVAEQLLSHIPRFDLVRGILASQRKSRRWRNLATNSHEAQLIGLGGEILRIAADYELLVGKGVGSVEAMATLRRRIGRYDVDLLDAFASGLAPERPEEEPVRELPLMAIRVGMVLAEDLLMQAGTLLVARGFEVTESFVDRVRGFEPGAVREPVRVMIGQGTREQ